MDKRNQKKKNPKIPDDMLTEPEIKNLINTAKNKRDKALIGLLWDIGGRIGEIGHLKIKDIKFDDYGGIIKVNGKTGFRRVRAVWSVEYLKQWLNEHPDKNNPESPVWINLSKKKESIEIMQYDSIRMRIKKIAKKAGINKRIHPHLFRHSRCTYMANYLTEAQMNHYFGWVQGSNMPSIYVHLSGRDIDDAILKANGFTGNNNMENKGMEINNFDDEIDRLVKKRVKEALKNITWK
ncbi:tyrosine-type recombinase/integrase [Methanohalobium evestigatum]|uniref:tyrosine-type recombinase/integrase n=1 Tax=Methanohalobium evestigatum TaxID=2322 RepID=UPI000678303D|nr:tyrosine-type recombinase/integrase [Methanohalobium evestigatum]